MRHFTPLLGLFDQNRQVDYTKLPPEQKDLLTYGTSIKISKYPLEDGFLISVIQTRIIPDNKVKNFRYLIKIENNRSITCGEFLGGGNISKILEKVYYDTDKNTYVLKLTNGETISVDDSLIMALKAEGDTSTLAGCIVENTGLGTHDKQLVARTINAQLRTNAQTSSAGVTIMMITKSGKTTIQKKRKAQSALTDDDSEDEDEDEQEEEQEEEEQEEDTLTDDDSEDEYTRNGDDSEDEQEEEQEEEEQEEDTGNGDDSEAIRLALSNRTYPYNISIIKTKDFSPEETLKRELLYNQRLIHKLNQFDLKSMKIELLARNTNTGALTGALGDDRRNNPGFGGNLADVFKKRGQIVKPDVAAEIIYSLIITFKYGNSKVGLFIKNYIKKEEILEQFERSIVGSIEKYTQGESVKPHIKEMLETIVTNLITLIEQTLKKEKNALKEKIEALEEELKALKQEAEAAEALTEEGLMAVDEYPAEKKQHSASLFNIVFRRGAGEV